MNSFFSKNFFHLTGTYAYFVTVSATGAAAFPYVIGTNYYGSTVNTQSTTVPTAGVTKYY